MPVGGELAEQPGEARSVSCSVWPDAGSSSSSTRGWPARARASSTSRAWPVGSSSTEASARSPSPTRSMSGVGDGLAVHATRAGVRRCRSAATLTFSRTDRSGEQLEALEGPGQAEPGPLVGLGLGEVATVEHAPCRSSVPAGR